MVCETDFHSRMSVVGLHIKVKDVVSETVEVFQIFNLLPFSRDSVIGGKYNLKLIFRLNNSQICFPFRHRELLLA